MALPNDRSGAQDVRWEDHVPWSLRYSASVTKGDYGKFFSLLSVRLGNLISFNEAKLKSVFHFVGQLASESLGKFETVSTYTPSRQIKDFFTPEMLRAAAIR